MEDWNTADYRREERRRYETIRSDFSDLVTRAFECRQGWYGILRSFFAAVKDVLPEAEQFKLLQVKEKLGSLRIYYHLSETPGTEVGDAIRKAKTAAEDASFHVCEVCGQPGGLRVKGGWYVTRCEDHADGAEPYKSDGDA